jgi:acyl-CoA thioester hydrolase
MSATRPLAVELPIEVKTYDVDYANIVHNMVYIRWLEDLRLLLITNHYPLTEVLASGRSPILTRTEIDYLYPTRFGDQVVGRMWLSTLSRVRWTVTAEIHAGPNLAASSIQQGYFADLQTLRPIRIPDPLRRAWEAAQE